MLSSDECPKPQRRFLKKTLSQDRSLIERVPPVAEDLAKNLPWLNIMADLALTAAIAEIKVPMRVSNFFLHFEQFIQNISVDLIVCNKHLNIFV